MGSINFIKVRDAAISLSKSLTENNSSCKKNNCNYVSAVTFNGGIRRNVDFKENVLTYSDFPGSGYGGTNYTNALSAAYDKLNNIISNDNNNNNNRFFVIFLSDGEPGDSKRKYEVQVNNIKNLLKPKNSDVEYGKIITVGFEYNNTRLIDIASSDCKGVGTNCYYEAGSSNIGEVFNDFFNVIKKEVMCSTYKKSKISIELSDNFKFSDKSNKKIITQELKCNKEDFINNIQTQKLIEDELYDLEFTKPNENLEIGTHEFPIIKSISVEFYDDKGKKIPGAKIELNSDDFPKVKLDIEEISVVN